MQLTWSTPAEIATALLAAYPEMDRLSLSREQILALVLTLPSFHDSGTPPQPACLDHILWTWMRLADSGFEEKEQRRL